MELEMTSEARAEAESLKLEISRMAATERALLEELHQRQRWPASARAWTLFALVGLGLIGAIGVRHEGLAPVYGVCISIGAAALYVARRDERAREWKAGYVQELTAYIASKKERLQALTAPERLADLLGVTK